MSSKILVIDDEKPILDNIRFVLELEGHEVIVSTDFVEGLSILEKNISDIQVVITDMRMPKYSGLDILKTIKKRLPEMSVIILTGHGDMDNAILAMKEGAYEYLSKPVDASKLSLTVKNAISQKNILTDNKKMHKQIIDNRNYLKNLHDSAQKILLNLVPERLPKLANYDFASKYISSDEVGGDLYNVYDFDDYICFYVFDVSSHGILASVITVILSSFLQNIEYIYNKYLSAYSLKNIVKTLNTKLLNNTAQNIFVSLFIAFINKETSEMTYVSAGHIPQYVLRNNKLIPLESSGPILGVFDESTFESVKISLKPKDKIFLFTDGLIEAQQNGKNFGVAEIEKILISSSKSSIKEAIENIYSQTEKYCNHNFQDDVTILGIEKLY